MVLIMPKELFLVHLPLDFGEIVQNCTNASGDHGFSDIVIRIGCAFGDYFLFIL